MKLLKLYSKKDILVNYITLRRKHVRFGCDFQILGRIRVHGTGEIIIGDGCVFLAGDNYNPSSGDGVFHLNTFENGRLLIGNNVGLSNVSISAKRNVIIEDNVQIGSGCIISDYDFHSIYYESRINGDGDAKSQPVLIKKGAFIGMKAIVLKGVTIGEKSVIAAGSVVTKNIPDNEVWGGNPARFIKKIEND